MQMQQLFAAALLSGSIILAGCGGESGVPAADDNQQTANPTPSLPHSLALSANSWVKANPAASRALMQEDGISNWRYSDQVISSFIHLPQTGELELAIRGKIASGQSTIEVSLAGQTQNVILNSNTEQLYYIGKFTISTPGYQEIKLRGVASSHDTFGELSSLSFGGSAASGASFIRDEVYWGRRGPSVHLSYQLPEATAIRYFYSEMQVPVGQDVIGSFYMANGFADGYFGIQVNSATERRVLFSVWSPYQTDDPSTIPEHLQVKLLRKGEQVVTGEFGNEGSGGQSFLRYTWQAGTTYQFLLKAEPQADNHTHYTAWFFAPEQAKWQLIAAFSRPETQRNIERPHSFLENFIPEMGDTSRHVYFPSQWFADAAGNWYQNRQASFSVDDTGRRGNRLDFAGAYTEQGLMLQNCGFFNQTTTPGSSWQLPAQNRVPNINLNQLP